MKKIFINILYNGMYQIFLIITPIITLPYVSRVLGANQLGENSFILSITTILSIFIYAGMNQYGVREISKTNPFNLKKKFFELWINQLFVGIIIVLGYSILSFTLLDNEQRFFFYIQIPLLISYIIDVSWFFVGISEIKKVIIRNTLVKIICLFLIFFIIKKPDDLWKYMLINSLSSLIANSIFWVYLREYFAKDNSKIRFIIKPSLNAMLLIIPQLAAQFYTSFDKTLVGIISGNIQLSYYDQSQKIARLMLTIITSMSIVLMPLMAENDSKDNKKINTIFKISLDYTLFFATLCCGLLMVNSTKFVPWFFGADFVNMTQNVFWVSLIIIPIAYGGVFSNQLALSKGLYKKYTIPYVVGAVISVILNLLLIPKFGSFGAVITLIVTEVMVCLMRIFIVRHEFDRKGIFKHQVKYLGSFSVATIFCLSLPTIFNDNFHMLVYKSLVYLVLYFFISFILKVRMVEDLKIILKRKKSEIEKG